MAGRIQGITVEIGGDTTKLQTALFPERQENGSILKRIRFKFRVDYDAEAGGRVLLNENDVETVCLLSNRKPDTKVRIDVDLEDYYRIKEAKKNQN